MIKTYIYGVPHGFDFYEKDAKLNDYFKGFYISSRRGRRLMINRRDNGETIYSYLRYGLNEVDRQALHSFFGMSLVIDNYQFCPNFKVLLEWFDYLFNKLVNEHSLIQKNKDGILHYTIHKFDENSNDIEWLKSNLPNILTKSDQTEIVHYDNSFVDGKSGQIVSFNHQVGENCLLETFKKYCWISISSEIVEWQDIVFGGPIEEIELSFEDLNWKLNEFNQQLLPIAIDITKGSYPDLKRMADEVQEINASLVKYLPSIEDSEEKEKFGKLDGKYDSLNGSIRTLLSKFTISTKPLLPQPPKPENQYCFSCKQNKPSSQFRSLDATKCLECEEQDRQRAEAIANVHKGYKICISCGKEKPDRFFNQDGTNICDECAKDKEEKTKFLLVLKGLFEKLSKALISKWFLGILASITIVWGGVFAAINLPFGRSTCDVAGGGGNAERFTRDSVDRDKLDSLIATSDLKKVYEYVQGKKDADNYKSHLKNIVNSHLWAIVDSSNSSQEDLQKFYILNKAFLDYIDFTDEDKQKWNEIVEDYKIIWDILNKPNVTEADLRSGNEALTKHSELFPAEWRETLSHKPKVVVSQAQMSENEEASQQETGKNIFTLIYIKAADGNEATVKIDCSKSNIGYDGLIGTEVKVTCSDGKGNDEIFYTCTLTEARPYVIKLNDTTVLTITSMPQNLYFEQ